MDVLHLYKDFSPVLGGIENHIRQLSEAQRARGHRVTVLACARGPTTLVGDLNGVRVIRAGRLATLASMPLSLRQPLLLRRQRPDVVHVHSPYPLGEASNLLLGRARATVITHHSDVVRQRRLLALYGPVLRLVLRRADGLIATSAPALASSPWLAPVRHRCAVVPLAIDVTRFSRGAGSPRARPPFTVLFVGALRHYKGVDTLLRALAAVPEARLEVVGGGPMRPAWERLATELGLATRARFLGQIPDGDLPGRYAAADLFVLPSTSRAEAFGMVLLEAMAAGLPVISTELGTGTSWVNQDGITGRVVPAGDAAALARAIRGLLGDAAARAQMGESARRRVETEFTLPLMVERVERVYEEALRRAADRSPDR